ncbi:MAG: hypothetical protein EPN37_11115 [Chitinophagaceae bacterium]|nr:MAG: hypothetical protein EPN37_11115 [Chitinophagaceae bacterium]
MKFSIKIFSTVSVFTMILLHISAFAQKIQYFRPDNKDGINMFETTKKDTVQFTSLKVKVGGNFTQDFQMLRDENNATPAIKNGVDMNQLMKLTNGFNLAMANLNVDVQLSDGIRLNLTTYLSTRHHQDTWVKGGYIQFDKLLFLKSPVIDKLMNYLTIKIGDFDVDYGDAHFRRTDGGNSIYNPFVENYIMDAFATEIGGEIYYHSNGGLLVMAGITDGQLNPTVTAPANTDAATGKTNRYLPAFHGKLGFDKQFTPDLRFRITGSFYTNKSNSSNTLYWGDRTGSHYFLVMENTTADAANNAWSGRFNPMFSEQVNAYSVNPFLKYSGLEFFGTAEIANGRTISETSLRRATQLAGEIIYRFPPGKENFWIGGRYNTVRAALPGYSNDVNINRVTGSAGWFLTKNVMLKAEYVNQAYKDFPISNIRSGGKFSGEMVEASVGF